MPGSARVEGVVVGYAFETAGEPVARTQHGVRGPASPLARRASAGSLVFLFLLPAPVATAFPSAAGNQGARALASPADRPHRVWVEREAFVMGTRLRLRIAGADRAAALRASEAAMEAISETDDLLSTWRAGTALADFNAAPIGHRVPVSAPLADLLDEVAAWTRETRRAFDPAVGALVDAWNLRGIGRVPSPTELERALDSSGPRCFDLEARERRARRLCPEGWLDSGGFGKGAALRRARRALESTGARSALLDFGGQQLAYGPSDRGSAWAVDVAHPARRHQPVARIRVTEGSVATTGQSERAILTPAGRFGHVIDPRSGHPVPAWGSVTVVAHDPLTADILSTALFVMGPSEGLEWLDERPDIPALFLVDGPRGVEIRASGAMRSLLQEEPTADRRATPARPRPIRGSAEGTLQRRDRFTPQTKGSPCRPCI